MKLLPPLQPQQACFLRLLLLHLLLFLLLLLLLLPIQHPEVK